MLNKAKNCKNTDKKYNTFIMMVRFVVSTDPESMTAGANSLDLILNTVSANHDLTHYLSLLVSFGWAGFGYSMHSPTLPTGEIWVGVGYGINP